MYNILQTTDKDNPITINGIIKKLDNEHKYGKVTRQTIYSYRDILLSCDDEVKLNLGTNGRSKAVRNIMTNSAYKVNFWAQKSPTLTSRLIQNMEFFKVVAPKDIVEEIKNCACDIMAIYN